MTANGPSPHRNPAEEPPRRRLDNDARLCLLTKLIPTTTPRSPAHQQPHPNAGDPGDPHSPADAAIHIRPAHRCGQAARREDVKSP